MDEEQRFDELYRSVVEATIGGVPEACRTSGEGYFLTSGLAQA